MSALLSVLGTLFPNGVVHYALGGVLIGLGVVLIYLGTGITPGASAFLESTLSYVSARERFQRPAFLASRGWRLVFTAGIVSGAALYTLTVGAVWTTEVQLWRLAVGGFLVGVGTRIGKGCTSGHGICGVGSRSPTSTANVVIFVLVAILTAGVVTALGIQP